MKKFTSQYVLAANPGATPYVVAAALVEVNAPASTLQEHWAAEDADIIASFKDPPALDRGGLTAAMRTAKAFADERGLPIPFPPHPEE